MTETELLTNKIKEYLQGLTPAAVESLVRKLEKSREAGLTDRHLDLILAASVKLLRTPEIELEAPTRGIIRRNQIQRMFFTPLDDFIINEKLPNHQEGRVHRPNLQKVWTWLSRDILPGDVRMVLEETEKPSASEERIDSLVYALRRRAVDAVGSALDNIETSEKERRRLSIEIGGERGIAELKDIHKILEAERWLQPFLNLFPETLTESRIKSDRDVLNLVDKCSTRYPDHIPVVAAALLDRAETPASLCAFAGRLARTDDPKAISSSPYAPFVDVVLSEAERLNVLALEHRQHNPDPVAFSQALTEYHDLVRGVELDMDLSHAGKWHKQLAETKRDVSDAVTRELKNAHGAVRRALQVPTWNKDGELEQDFASIDEAVRTLRVVVMVRNASDTLAVNDVGNRTRQTVEQTLEIVTRSLISELGKTVGPQRQAHLAAVDVAIMLSEIFFGEDYAAQLRRSRQSAVAQVPEASGPAKFGKPRLISA